MSKFVCSLLTAYFLLFSSVAVLADEVTLKNGDRLSGKILEKDEEVIVLETAYAGAVRIAAGHVEKVIVGEAPKPDAQVAAAPEPASPPPAAAKPEKKELKPVPKLFGEGRFFGIADGWSGNGNIGFSYTSGNSSTTTMTTGIRAVKAGHSDNLTVYFRSLWNTNRKLESNSTTSNAIWGGARYDRNINDRMFGFGSFDFESDRPRNLNFRSVIGTGFGHHTIRNDRTQMDVFVGAAWNRTWQAGDNTDTPESLIGNSLKHRITDRLKLQENFTYFQNITDSREHRYIMDTTLLADVTKKVGWYITVGNRFNNDPIGNAEKNDFMFTTGIKWNFGKKK